MDELLSIGFYYWILRRLENYVIAVFLSKCYAFWQNVANSVRNSISCLKKYDIKVVLSIEINLIILDLHAIGIFLHIVRIHKHNSLRSLVHRWAGIFGASGRRWRCSASLPICATLLPATGDNCMRQATTACDRWQQHTTGSDCNDTTRQCSHGDIRTKF